jgi:hypothetical protein
MCFQLPEVDTMKKELVIEWRHIASDTGTTCERCGETGIALAAVIKEISMLLEMEGVAVTLHETIIPREEIAESNSILFNGVPLEDLVEGMEVTTTPCTSCAACMECQEDVECRAVEYHGERYEAIPPELIGRAALKALEME